MDLSFGEAEAVLCVRDTGKGFDLSTPPRDGSFGLSTMRDRAEALGGKFRIVSAPGSGTEILVSVPIEREEK